MATEMKTTEISAFPKKQAPLVSALSSRIDVMLAPQTADREWESSFPLRSTLSPMILRGGRQMGFPRLKMADFGQFVQADPPSQWLSDFQFSPTVILTRLEGFILLNSSPHRYCSQLLFQSVGSNISC